MGDNAVTAFPPQHVVRLFRHCHIWIRVGVDKNMGVGLQIVDKLMFEEVPMFIRHVFERPANPGIGPQRGISSVSEPIGELVVRFAGREHHLFMIALEGCYTVRLREFQDALQDSSGVWTAINIIAQENQVILRRGGDALQQRVEVCQATVNIAYYECARSQ